MGLSSRFPQRTVYVSSLSSTWASRADCFILLDVITWVMFGEGHSFCRFLCVVLLRPSQVLISSSAPHSQTSSAYFFSLNMKDPCKTTENFIVLYILIFILLDSELEDRRFCSECFAGTPWGKSAFNFFTNDILIFRVVPIYLDFATFSKIYYLYLCWETWSYT